MRELIKKPSREMAQRAFAVSPIGCSRKKSNSHHSDRSFHYEQSFPFLFPPLYNILFPAFLPLQTGPNSYVRKSSRSFFFGNLSGAASRVVVVADTGSTRPGMREGLS